MVKREIVLKCVNCDKNTTVELLHGQFISLAMADFDHNDKQRATSCAEVMEERKQRNDLVICDITCEYCGCANGLRFADGRSTHGIR